MNKNSIGSPLPDVALQTVPRTFAALDWVGMSNIQMPIVYREEGMNQQVQGNIDAYVNLVDPSAKGIHMSRLYLLLEEMKEITPPSVQVTLEKFLQTHKDISTASRLEIAFDLMIQRPSLVSDNTGWRFYPSHISVELRAGKITYHLTSDIVYSSTCPCSKSLASHLIQDKFAADFKNSTDLSKDAVLSWLSENALHATPHSQRSRARVTVTLEDAGEYFPFIAITDHVEQALQTPVQAVVKREDEQRFALLNGQNPMFCEDSARAIKEALRDHYQTFKLKVEHFESLHPHDAVAFASSD